MTYDLETLRGDLFGGVTSTIVALPVALGFGVASGLGAAAGLYGAIAVGFFASVFGGTRSQISGPTGPMTVAMAAIVASHAATLTEALTIVVLAGLLQVLLGLSRVGRFVAYTPYVVVSGFMSGIGIIIILIQAMPFLGAPTAPGGPMGAVAAFPEAIANVNADAFAVAAVTLAVAVLWPRRLARLVPSLLVALVAGTLVGVLWLDSAPVIGAVPTGLPGVQIGLPSAGFLLRALEPALILALLGSVDSLLTSLIADSLTGTRHDPNRELVGQGIGNIVAGLFGALPGAGATMGTVTNIRAGGRTRVSGALRALLLLGLVLGLGRYVEPIPLAVLAGVLMKVGWDIIDWRLLARVHRIRRDHLVVMLMTLGLTVFVDLITAVAIGLIAAGMSHARRMERMELDSVVSVPILDRTFFGDAKGQARSDAAAGGETSGAGEPGTKDPGAEDPEMEDPGTEDPGTEDPGAHDPYSARVGLVALRGSFTVASSHKLVSVIGADIKDHEVTIFDFSGATYVDDSAAMVIEQLIEVAGRQDTEVIVMGAAGRVADTLHTLDVLQHVPDGHEVETLDEAREVARTLLQN